MLEYKGMFGYLIAGTILYGIPFVHPASKGQRVLSSPDIPVTQFTCVGRPPGYYADLETGCQVYHMCTEGGNQFSYRCPNTTLFQQRMLICAHWYQVNCSRSEQHYSANLLIGQRDKPFVDDLIYSSQNGKQVKTLQNPDTLQNLGHSKKDTADKQINSQAGPINTQANKVFQNNYKRDGEASLGFHGKTTGFTSSFPTTAFPSRTPEDLSSLPLAGSVLPGGVKSFQLPPNRNSQLFQSTIPSLQNPTTRTIFESVPSGSPPEITQSISFTPITTPKPVHQFNFDQSTKSTLNFHAQVTNSNTFQPSSFETQPLNGNVLQKSTSNSNTFQPSSFETQSLNGNVLQQSTSESSRDSLDFQSPSDQKQDLTVASQENAYSSRLSTTVSPSLESDGNLPVTDIKAVIEPTKNGSLPDDKYNTFIKRFNPYEESPTSEDKVAPEQAEPEYHTFINRFVPSFGPSAPADSTTEQPEEHVFINRFVLTPEELKREKDKENVNQLHQLQPPEQLTVNFPNFDLSPPFDDADDSESNKIELHLQDTRRNLFIPEEDNDFSRADAAPIVITIPLHSLQKSPPMWFKTDKSSDPCARCHPAFITNKDTCLPCVIIR